MSSDQGNCSFFFFLPVFYSVSSFSLLWSLLLSLSRLPPAIEKKQLRQFLPSALTLLSVGFHGTPRGRSPLPDHGFGSTLGKYELSHVQTVLGRLASALAPLSLTPSLSPCLCLPDKPGITGSQENHILVIVIIVSVGVFTIIAVVVGAFLCTRRSNSHQKKWALKHTHNKIHSATLSLYYIGPEKSCNRGILNM